MSDVVTLVLVGGQGERLYPLTKIRSKPAVPIAGRFRLIDISLSNCLHSGLRKIFILTQCATESLHRHITKRRGWWPLWPDEKGPWRKRWVASGNPLVDESRFEGVPW